MSMKSADQLGDLDPATSVFLATRPRLFGIAYRMLGSAAEAEDIVQETWIRWQASDRSTVLDPPAFLATITLRLSLNLAQSAHSRRVTYIGPWLPEPVDTASDPYLGAERGQALSVAVLSLLEKLSPVERAAYILREAFDYSYDAIASLLELSLVNARQIVTRARRHLADTPSAKKQQPPQHLQQEQLLRAFIQAAQHGDLVTLERLFASEIVSTTDGNGVVNAARIPVTGRSRVAKLVTNPHFWRNTSITYLQANGQPSLLVFRNGSVIAFATLEMEGDQIGQIFWVMNPSKLASISRLYRPV